MGGRMADTNPTNINGASAPKRQLPEALRKNMWKKGQSGNPSGTKEGTVSIVAGIKRKLLEIEPVNKKTYLELFLNSYFKNAIKDGDTSLIRDMINRVDGMPKQFIENTGDMNLNIKIVDDKGTD